MQSIGKTDGMETGIDFFETGETLMRDETLAALAISETGFIFNPRTGSSYLVGHTGAVILDALKKGHSPKEICRTLAECFDVPLDTSLDEDVGQFLFQLQCEGLIENHGGEAPVRDTMSASRFEDRSTAFDC